jgi:hypothetical protein
MSLLRNATCGVIKMNCIYCGYAIPPTALACPACGRPSGSIPAKSSATAATTAAPFATSNSADFLYGIGGWLLIFVIALVFIGPLAHLRASILGYQHSVESFARARHKYSLYGFYFTEQILGLAFDGYSIFAGIQLWKIRAGAVQRARQFLLALLLFRFLEYGVGLIWTVLMAPDSARSIAVSKFAFGNAAMNLLRGVIFAAVWYSYLLRSRRVRATFPDAR